jgi:hypothetical protein
MKVNYNWSSILRIIGYVAMLLGAIDPLEGSLLILAGSGMVALGTFIGKCEHRLLKYRIRVFVLIATGVAAMWGLTWAGGFGGSSERSYWWGLLILPYFIGWYMGLWGSDSPRWMLWLSIIIGLWYLLLSFIVTSGPEPKLAFNSGLSVILIVIGIVTIGGSIYRLKNRLPSNQ